MITLRKKITFEAAHKLPNHDGKCQRLHGHSWVAWIVCKGKKLQPDGPKAGMLVDYGVIKEHTKDLLENVLDHHYLNETTKLENPTSEELARFIFDKLKSKIPYLDSIEVEETCTSSCKFCP